MMKPEIMTLIPARSGSKGIPDKNIKIFRGEPLLAHSIKHALGSKLNNRTLVSTDSAAYAEIAQQYGAEVPFLRPAEISQDSSTDLEVFEHALQWLKENLNYVPDICVHLRPTYPIRRVEDIDDIIRILLENPELDSVRSVTVAPDTPFKMWFRSNDGSLSPVMQTEIKEAYNLPRQVLPTVYLQNACIDAVRARVITEQRSMTGQNIYGHIIDHNFDIDTEAQLQKLAGESTLWESIKSEKRTFCIDVDGVIATIVPGNQYDQAAARTETIAAINALYDRGHRIILYTARGSATGIDWIEVTKKQMSSWGVKYHELLFGKPAADFYIDDRLISLDHLHGLLSEF